MGETVAERFARQGADEPDAALERLLDDVHRIADGIGGIRELVVAITPNTPPAAAMARLHVTPSDVTVMRDMVTHSTATGASHATVPIAWVRSLLKVLDDPRWVP
jgi:hypothetical protein